MSEKLKVALAYIDKAPAILRKRLFVIRRESGARFLVKAFL